MELKPATRAVLRHAHLMRALYPFARVCHARLHRESRRSGVSNQEIVRINFPSAKERLRQLEAEYAAAPDEPNPTDAAPTDAAPADDAPPEDPHPTEAQETVADECASDATPPPRRRRPRARPKKRQAEFSFGSDQN